MKKINLILLSIIFAASSVYANFNFLSNRNPYAMGVEGRDIDALTSWSTPTRSAALFNGRPVGTTDMSGSRSYYTYNGKMAVTVEKDGSISFMLGGKTKSIDSKGNIKSISQSIEGTNWVETRNEFGEILGYKELGFGGKVVRTYDKEKNLVSVYNYDQYGKGIVSIVNEMTKNMTVFDSQTGLAMYDLDAEGNRVMKYIYDDYNRLTEKIDVYGNISHYDTNGAITYTEDKDGVIMSKYNYKYDEGGNYILESVVSPRTQETTYFDEQGRQTVTKNHANAVTTQFLWMGSKLIATFDMESQQTTWYEVDGKAMYTTFNDKVISKNLYYKGQLVGIWDARTNQVTVLQNERRELVIQLGGFGDAVYEIATLVRCSDGNGSFTVLRLEDFKNNSKLNSAWTIVEEFEGYVLKTDEDGAIVEFEPVIEPTAEDIKRWIDAGLIDKKYLFGPL